MRPLPFISIVCAAACACGPLLQAAPPAKGFDAMFGLFKTRNIFDPQRQPGSTAEATPAPARVTRADFAALRGILVTPGKVLAFFSGSRPEFNAVLGPQGTIAGATLTRITPSFIEVQRDGKTIPIAIGQTVPLDANSSPAPAPAADGSTAAAAPGGSPALNPATPASTPSAGVDREAVMRRMMQKRQQELR